MTFDGVEYLAGVTSRGTSTCGDGLDIAVRIDSHSGWLTSYINQIDPVDCTLNRSNPLCGGGSTPGQAPSAPEAKPISSGCNAAGTGISPRDLSLWVLLTGLLALLVRRRRSH
jgi:MYXO-CTERM domain-containing protein